MTEASVQVIVERIAVLEARAAERLDRIEQQVTCTNGRVTELERDRIVRDAVADAAAVRVEQSRLSRGQLMQLAGVLIAFEGAVVALALATEKLL